MVLADPHSVISSQVTGDSKEFIVVYGLYKMRVIEKLEQTDPARRVEYWT